MVRLLSDQNFNGDIVRGLLLRRPTLDLIRVQDVGLDEADDPILLETISKRKNEVKPSVQNTQSGGTDGKKTQTV